MDITNTSELAWTLEELFRSYNRLAKCREDSARRKLGELELDINIVIREMKRTGKYLSKMRKEYEAVRMEFWRTEAVNTRTCSGKVKAD